MSVQAPAFAPPAVPFAPPPLPAAAPAAPKFTVQQYFEIERQSEIRYEYVEGELIAMPGVTLPHNEITLNIALGVKTAFQGRDCRVYAEAVRVRVSPTQYRYPDVVAICGERVTDGENPPALLNPGVIVEVLSSSTEAKDKGEKFAEYKRMASLTDYVLAAQDEILVTHYVRQSPRQWTITDYTELTDALTFAALGVTLTVADIYSGIAFPAPAAP